MVDSQFKIIIPAAGFGRRMGPIAAKELLPHPKSGNPLILETIKRHQSLEFPFHIISRRDKTELNEYITTLKSENQYSVSLQLIESSKEWPDTVLKSKDYWSDWNLLLLPDTDYGPIIKKDQVEQIIKLKKTLVHFFTFNVRESSSWGLLQTNEDSFLISEKPIMDNTVKSTNQELLAWGMILFHKEIGIKLFMNLIESSADHLWKKIEQKPGCIPLDYFTDLTRK